MRRFRWTQNVCYYRAGEGIDNKHAFYYYRAEVGLSYVRTGKVERGALRPPVSDYYTGKFQAVQSKKLPSPAELRVLSAERLRALPPR